jgi:hypothetical protein
MSHPIFHLRHPLISNVGLAVFVLLAAAASTTVPVAAQTANSSAPLYVPRLQPVPRVQLFGGYSYLFPNATASGYLPNGIVPVSTCLCAIPPGGGLSASYEITPWFGVTLDGSGHVGGKGSTPATRLGNADAYNIAAGPTFTYRRKHVAPFVEALFGGDRLAPSAFHQDTTFGIVAGGGLDLPLGRHIAFRLFQADLVHASHHFGPSPAVAATNENGLRLQSGIVFSFGGAAAPVTVLPVKAAPAPVIAAAEVAPAPAPLPMPAPVDNLTLTAAAVPDTMPVGSSSIITANAASALGRPLTFTYGSSIGVVGTQPGAAASTALLTTAGAVAGVALVTVTVANDLGQTAVATVPVTLDKVAVLPEASTRALCAISFRATAARPARVNNEAKACLDDIALALQQDVDARLVLIGNAPPSRPAATNTAAHRAVNTKLYLVADKGIDPARIDVYTGTAASPTVSTILIPAGATLDATGLTRIDERQVKAVPRKGSPHR